MHLLSPLLLLLAACAAPSPGSAPIQSKPASLRVATFNIRYGNAPDGPDAWPLRSAWVVGTIAGLDGDLVGLQEALEFQVDELRAALPRYRFLGRGRDAGGGGEWAPLLVDAQRFEVLEHGTRWLSPTPGVEGSVGWDAALPRICTWARLRDRSGGKEFLLLNAHLDHRGKRARLESARLLRLWATELGDLPVILTGDLNAAEDSAPLAELLPTLPDTFRVIHPAEDPGSPPAGTFNGFRDLRDGPKIDYILASPHWQVLDATLHRPRRHSQSPSDHDPLTTLLR